MSRRKEKVLARDPGYVVGLIALAGVWAEIWGISQSMKSMKSNVHPFTKISYSFTQASLATGLTSLITNIWSQIYQSISTTKQHKHCCRR